MKQRHQNRIIRNEDMLVYSQRIHSSAIFKKEVSNSNLFICLCLLVFLCIHECVSCDLVIMEDVRGNLLPGTMTVGGYQSPHRSWKQEPCSLQQQQMLPTALWKRVLTGIVLIEIIFYVHAYMGLSYLLTDADELLGIT